MGVELEKREVQIWKKANSLSETGQRKYNDRTEVLHEMANRYSDHVLERTERLTNREIHLSVQMLDIAVKVASRHKKGDHALSDWELAQLKKINKLENGLKLVQKVEQALYKDLLKFSSTMEDVAELELDRILALEAPEPQPCRTATDGSNASVSSEVVLDPSWQSTPTVDEPDMGDQN